jgi:hypothetical protein
MDMTATLAKQGEAASSPFGAILAGALTEMEIAAAEALTPEDAVRRLSLDAHRTLARQDGGPLPRAGGQVYLQDSAALPTPVRSLLDVRF